MIIQANLQAINTHRQMNKTVRRKAKSMEKLSSGYRINRSADDAAGLAISEKMRGQIRGLNQASRNAQDGISLIQTAEGALSESQNIIHRMRELAVQSANDTNVEADRQALQNEMDELVKEIDRIADNTEFNTMKVLNGSFKDKKFQVGANKGQEIGLSIGRMDSPSLKILGDVKIDVDRVKLDDDVSKFRLVNKNTNSPITLKFEEHISDTLKPMEASKTGNIITVKVHRDADLTADDINTAIQAIDADLSFNEHVAIPGKLDVKDLIGRTEGNLDDLSISCAPAIVEPPKPGGIHLAAMSHYYFGDGAGNETKLEGYTLYLDKTANPSDDLEISIDETSKRINITWGEDHKPTREYQIKDLLKTATSTSPEIQDLVRDINFTCSTHGENIYMSDDLNGQHFTFFGGHALPKDIPTSKVKEGIVIGADLSTILSDGEYVVEKSAGHLVLKGDNGQNLALIENADNNTSIIKFNKAGKTASVVFANHIKEDDVIIVSNNGKEQLLKKHILKDKENIYLEEGKYTIDSLGFIENNGEYVGKYEKSSGDIILNKNNVKFSLKDVFGLDKGIILDNIKNKVSLFEVEGAYINTRSSAVKMIAKLDKANEIISSQRAYLGAIQNRLEHTIANDDTSAENLQAAESRIRDIDMAKEMMNLTRDNILSQASQVMLSQANQNPNKILELLR